MQAGHVFFGQNRYPQAANAYRQALRGPGADQARVLAGIALVRAGDGAGARQLLDGVPDTSPFNDIAELWSLYAQTQRA